MNHAIANRIHADGRRSDFFPCAGAGSPNWATSHSGQRRRRRTPTHSCRVCKRRSNSRPDQVEKILAAHGATVDSPEIPRAQAKGRPERDRRRTRDRLREARPRPRRNCFKEVDEILTKDQKALIEKINDAYAKVAAEVGEDFQAEVRGREGERRGHRRADGRNCARPRRARSTRSSDGLLTAEQQKAVKKAAEIEASGPPTTRTR